MSDIEKLLGMVADVGRLRGAYDAVCAERDALKAELASCDKYAKEQYAAYDERIKSLEESLKEWQLDFASVQKDRDAWEAKAERYKEALEKAIVMIRGEFCSHPEPHSKDLETCYVQEFLSALAGDGIMGRSESSQNGRMSGCRRAI